MVCSGWVWLMHGRRNISVPIIYSNNCKFSCFCLQWPLSGRRLTKESIVIAKCRFKAEIRVWNDILKFFLLSEMVYPAVLLKKFHLDCITVKYTLTTQLLFYPLDCWLLIADFSVQIFRQEHLTKIVVGLSGFVDDGSDFQELLILEI